MREILYKAKRIDNGEWVYGSYLYTFCEDKNCPIVGSVMRNNDYMLDISNGGYFYF